MSSTSEYEAIVYYKIGISGSTREAVSSFVIKVTEDTTIGELNEILVDKLNRAAIEVGSEFTENLHEHLFNEMTRDDDQDQAEQ